MAIFKEVQDILEVPRNQRQKLPYFKCKKILEPPHFYQSTRAHPTLHLHRQVPTPTLHLYRQGTAQPFARIDRSQTQPFTFTCIDRSQPKPSLPSLVATGPSPTPHRASLVATRPASPTPQAQPNPSLASTRVIKPCSARRITPWIQPLEKMTSWDTAVHNPASTIPTPNPSPVS